MEATVELPNLLRAGARPGRTAPPCVVVIFGATGDLTSRKLIPAFYQLALGRYLPAEFAVLGLGRQEYSHDGFREELRAAANRFARSAPVHPVVWESFASRIFYQRVSYDDAAAYETLRDRLAELDRRLGTQGNYLFY
ncbi:MAG: glucose-6-phosphate dehydrogenase, partial [Chloroflexi bacterium]|nr:glucose-6-phosphate dehydrogenase [Chloroflexota bacterium]